MICEPLSFANIHVGFARYLPILITEGRIPTRQLGISPMTMKKRIMEPLTRVRKATKRKCLYCLTKKNWRLPLER